MFYRRLYNHQTLMDFFHSANIQKEWEELVRRYPSVYSSLWKTLPSRQCQEALAHRHWDNTEGYLRLREGLCTLFWALGGETATELLYAGQVPALVGLLTLKDGFTNTHGMATHDLQTHLIITALRQVSFCQTDQDPDYLAVALLEELSLPKTYRHLLLECFIQLEVSQQQLLKGELDGALRDGGVHF